MPYLAGTLRPQGVLLSYSLLRSVDELFGLDPLGEAEGAKVHSFASAFVATETTAGD
jgi:hypothetical protein